MARFYRRRGFKRRRIGGFRRRRFGGRRRYFRRFRRTLRRFAIASPERKFADAVISGTIPNVATGVTPQLITGIEEGTDNNQRIGRRVLLTNVQIRMQTNAVRDHDTENSYIVRILMVMDTQYDGASGTVPTLDQVLDLSTPSIYAFNDLQVQGTRRFKTLWDKTFVQYAQYMTTDTTVRPDSWPNTKQHKYFKKMRKQLFFNGSDDSPALAGKNAIWLFIFKEPIVGTGILFSVEGNIRIRFTDV